MSFPAYREYKESGVPWLGAVPAHWATAAGRRLFRQVREPSRAEDEQLSASQKYGVIPQSRLMQLEDQKVVLALKGLSGFKHVDKDDFVISLRSFQGGIEHSAFSGCVSPAYTVLKLTVQQCPRYFFYVLKSGQYIATLQSVTDGIRDGKNISYEQFGQVRLPMPERDEQQAIATFLDRETMKIDALVAEQERLIALLTEKRQAVISHAVTKGLDPDVPLKDSGIEWLGDIPAHWGVASTKRVIETATSGPRGWSDLEADEGSFFFQSQNIGRNMDADFSVGKRIETPEGPDADRARLRQDDVVVCITGGRTGAVGHIASISEDAYVNQHVCLVRPKREAMSGRYLSYCFFSQQGQEQLGIAMYGLKQGLSLDNIRTVLFAVPPKHEQRAITEHLDNYSTQVLALQGQAGQAIALLKERRAALISAVVTGKIDVRRLVEQHEMEAA